PAVNQNYLPSSIKLHNMRQMQFPQALETVLQTLERMRDESRHRPCASRSTLNAFKEAALRKIDIAEGHASSCPENKVGGPSGTGMSNAAASKKEKAARLAAGQEAGGACAERPHVARRRPPNGFGVCSTAPQPFVLRR